MGSNNDSTVLLFIFAFYTFIFVMMGLIGISGVSSISSPSGNVADIGALNFFSYIGMFFEGIFFSISSLGVFNALLFAPLGLTMLYLLLKLFRGGG